MLDRENHLGYNANGWLKPCCEGEEVEYEEFQMAGVGYFMELRQKDFLKVVSSIRIFKALGSERGRQPHPKPFHYTVECITSRGGQ